MSTATVTAGNRKSLHTTVNGTRYRALPGSKARPGQQLAVKATRKGSIDVQVGDSTERWFRCNPLATKQPKPATPAPKPPTKKTPAKKQKAAKKK